MADVKDEISAHLAAGLADELATAWPAFPREPFTDGIDDALTPLALMARVELLADRLVEALPDDFTTAAKVLWATLESPTFTGWMTLPCGTYVARVGTDHPDIALPLLAGLTPRWSSEAPIRPFIERHPTLTYDHLRRWVHDPDEHVRRLVSEGTRPRLPWAPQLRGLSPLHRRQRTPPAQGLQAHPTPPRRRRTRHPHPPPPLRPRVHPPHPPRPPHHRHPDQRPHPRHRPPRRRRAHYDRALTKLAPDRPGSSRWL